MKIIEYDSFTTERGKGNPAGVVFLGKKMLEKTLMQEIAKSVGFNETVFISIDSDGFRFRFFTPGHEIDLCGHATIAAVGFLFDYNHIARCNILITTNIGKIEVGVSLDDLSNPIVTMQQGDSSFKEFSGSTLGLCNALGISRKDIDDSLPIVYGSTGTWTLLIPIKKLLLSRK